LLKNSLPVKDLYMMIAGILITVLDLTIPTGLVFTKYQNEKQTNNDYPV